MRISVVTVVRNGSTTIGETIRSVRDQIYGDVEHVVIDGASTDGTQDVINRYRDRIATFLSEPDRGIYDAMNKGIALATGDVVGFLNANDFYEHPYVLEEVARVMTHSEIDACYADLVYTDPVDTRRVKRYWKSRPYEEGLCRRGWMPAHPTFFVRRSVYDRFGAFDLEFRRQADFELALRLFDTERIRSVYVPEVWVRMRTGGVSNNSVLGVLKGNIEAYRACRKNGVKVTPVFILQKMFSRVPQFFSRPTRHASG